jgi:LCP family protein required for cell wall assembly
VLGGLYFGCLFVTSVTSMFSWIPVPRPPIPIIGQSDNLPTWKGTERVNILLLGLDQRPDERGQPTRSDTMIVVSIDPSTKSGGMLSLPRDLWVPIPGQGENKINTAHFFGEVEKKGNGPVLAKKTVQDLLGVPIHYYAKVDFQGFEKLIDMIGGVSIDVDRPVKDNEYPTEDYGVRRIYIPAGIQRMDGKTALQYARSRHADNDFSRSKRQQKVILAARQEALRLDVLPKVPSMIGLVLQSVQTDLAPNDLLALAGMAKSVSSENIVSHSIDSSMMIDVNGNGTVFKLKRDEAARVINEVFHSGEARKETATIEVQNGTSRAGLAGSTANLLKSSGYDVVEIGNADSDYKETVIIDYAGKKTTSEALAQFLRVPAKNVRSVASTGKEEADILIILGQDFRADVPATN